MKTCSDCAGIRLVTVVAKCSDNCFVEALYLDSSNDGYVPYDLGIGEVDYVRFTYCLDCGKIQGTFPLEDPNTEEWRI